jgi:hypothetical protein
MDNLISIIEMLEVATGHTLKGPRQEIIDYVEERPSLKAKVSNLKPEYASSWLATEEATSYLKFSLAENPFSVPYTPNMLLCFIHRFALKFTKDYTLDCSDLDAEKTLYPFAAGVSDFYKISVEISRKISDTRHFLSEGAPKESEFFERAHKLGFQSSHTKALKYAHFKRWTETMEGERYFERFHFLDNTEQIPYMEFLVIMAHVFDENRRGFHIPMPNSIAELPDSPEKVRAQQQVTQKFLGKKRSMNREFHDPECDYYLKEVLKRKQYLENRYPCPLRTLLKDRMNPPVAFENRIRPYAHILKNWWSWCWSVVFGGVEKSAVICILCEEIAERKKQSAEWSLF